MPSIFSDNSLWSHSSFIFTVVTQTKGIDKRGNKISEGKEVKITFKMKPKKTRTSASNTESGAEGKESYDCRVVSVDDDLKVVTLPKEINLEDVGTGEVNGRKCRAIIKAIAQSSVSQLLVGDKSPLLGESISIDIDYSIRRSTKG